MLCPEPDQARLKLESAYVAPRTPTEQTLVDIWKELLKVEQVGVNDNFFELGGHSLLVIQMISRIASTFEVTLPLQVLFETPTIGDVAQSIASSNGVDGSSNASAIKPIARQVRRSNAARPD